MLEVGHDAAGRVDREHVRLLRRSLRLLRNVKRRMAHLGDADSESRGLHLIRNGTSKSAGELLKAVLAVLLRPSVVTAHPPRGSLHVGTVPVRLTLGRSLGERKFEMRRLLRRRRRPGGLRLRAEPTASVRQLARPSKAEHAKILLWIRLRADLLPRVSPLRCGRCPGRQFHRRVVDNRAVAGQRLAVHCRRALPLPRPNRRRAEIEKRRDIRRLRLLEVAEPVRLALAEIALPNLRLRPRQPLAGMSAPNTRRDTARGRSERRARIQDCLLLRFS